MNERFQSFIFHSRVTSDHRTANGGNILIARTMIQTDMIMCVCDARTDRQWDETNETLTLRS